MLQTLYIVHFVHIWVVKSWKKFKSLIYTKDLENRRERFSSNLDCDPFHNFQPKTRPIVQLDGRTNGRTDGRTDTKPSRKIMCPEMCIFKTYVYTMYVTNKRFVKLFLPSVTRSQSGILGRAAPRGTYTLRGIQSDHQKWKYLFSHHNINFSIEIWF